MLSVPPGVADATLLLMRLMVAVVFIPSGWRHFTDPVARGKDIGMSAGFTRFLGAAEVLGGLGLAFGVLTQFAALGCIVVMLGVIQKKATVWHTGFFGEGGYGWDYEVLLILINLMIFAMDGGRWVLMK
jgi:putative oxidoreductase